MSAYPLLQLTGDALFVKGITVFPSMVDADLEFNVDRDPQDYVLYLNGFGSRVKNAVG
jgi:hypothetical protein